MATSGHGSGGSALSQKLLTAGLTGFRGYDVKLSGLHCLAIP